MQMSNEFPDDWLPPVQGLVWWFEEKSGTCCGGHAERVLL